MTQLDERPVIQPTEACRPWCRTRFGEEHPARGHWDGTCRTRDRITWLTLEPGGRVSTPDDLFTPSARPSIYYPAGETDAEGEPELDLMIYAQRSGDDCNITMTLAEARQLARSILAACDDVAPLTEARR